MAAGLGFKTFNTGEVLTAGDVNGYLMQGVLVFASAAARDAAITSPQEGQFAFTKDTNGLWYYDGAAWVASGATGDIEGVTAGVGISGGGTSGTVTVTNSMATAITTSGDLIYGTGSGTFTRRAIGSTNDVLTVAGGVPTWAAPAGGTPTYVGVSLTPTGGSVSISNAAWTTVAFGSEIFDTDSFHDNTTNNSRITIPAGKAGKYLINMQTFWANNATGSRDARLRLNGVDVDTPQTGYTANASNNAFSSDNVVALAVGDYIELRVRQDSGGALNLYAANSTFFTATWLGA
jgi:hypothetical protein